MREDDRSNRGSDVNIRPRFGLLENVPGLLSSNRGEDFRVVLEELARVKDPTVSIPRCKDSKGRVAKWPKAGFVLGDDWSIAYRITDAQYYGNPQRRKRIAVLCDFEGGAAGEILFVEHYREASESNRFSLELDTSDGCTGEVQPIGKGLPRYIEPSHKAWKGIARDPSESTGRCDTEDSFTLKVRGGSETYKDWNGQTRGAGKGPLVQKDMSATLSVSQDQTLFK